MQKWEYVFINGIFMNPGFISQIYFPEDDSFGILIAGKKNVKFNIGITGNKNGSLKRMIENISAVFPEFQSFCTEAEDFKINNIDGEKDKIRILFLLFGFLGEKGFELVSLTRAPEEQSYSQHGDFCFKRPVEEK